jgi:F-type H+-transporting ATPase subunit b
VKDKLTWVGILVVLLVLAFLVDHGNTHLGIPDWIWLAVNLTLFLYLLNRFVGKPMVAFLEARGEGIQEELAQAKVKLAEAEKLREEVAERLGKVENEVAEMRERAEAQGAAEAEKIDAQAAEEETRFMRRVEDQISRRQAETREQLAKDTAALTEQLTKELLSRTMTDDDRKRVLARSLSALEGLKDEE